MVLQDDPDRAPQIVEVRQPGADGSFPAYSMSATTVPRVVIPARMPRPPAHTMAASATELTSSTTAKD